jgi:hypothetical protein
MVISLAETCDRFIRERPALFDPGQRDRVCGSAGAVGALGEWF